MNKRKFDQIDTITPSPEQKLKSLNFVDLRKIKNIDQWIKDERSIYIGEGIEIQELYLKQSRWYHNFENRDQYIAFLQEWDLYLDIGDLFQYNLGFGSESGEKIANILEWIYPRRSTLFAENKTPGKIRKYFPIIGLSHGLNAKYARSVVEHGLLTWRELGEQKRAFHGLDTSYNKSDYGTDFKVELGTTPGVYFDPIFYGTERVRQRTTCNLIVDPYVLNRIDWHITIGDAFGAILPQSASRPTIIHFLNRLNVKKYSVIEIVLHNRVEPEFIQGFTDYRCDFWDYTKYDPDDRNRDRTKTPSDEELETMEEQSKQVKSEWMFKNGSKLDKSYYEADAKIIESVYLPLLSKKRFQRFCIARGGNEKDDFMDAKNCGISNDEILALCKDKNKEECWKTIWAVKSQKSEAAKWAPESEPSHTEYWPPTDLAQLSNEDEQVFLKL